MKTPEEMIKLYPELEKHHEYCRETFIHAKQYHHEWTCVCKFIKAYDAYLNLNKE